MGLIFLGHSTLPGDNRDRSEIASVSDLHRLYPTLAKSLNATSAVRLPSGDRVEAAGTLIRLENP